MSRDPAHAVFIAAAVLAGTFGLSPQTAAQEPGETAPPADRATEGSTFRITNFVHGRICRYEDGFEEICRRESDIRIEGKETCVWVGEERPCTWYGVQFDYENKDPDVPVHCEWNRSQPVNDGNYDEVRARGVTRDEYDLPIDDATGHYYHPMYNLYAPVPMPWYVVTFDFRCTYAGEEILHAPFRLIFSSVFNP